MGPHHLPTSNRLAQANPWENAGFHASDAKAWSETLDVDAPPTSFTDAERARIASRWVVCGFSPIDASEWLVHAAPNAVDHETFPQLARDWRRSGFTAASAGHWINSISPFRSRPDITRHFVEANWRPHDLHALHIMKGEDPTAAGEDEYRSWSRLNPDLAVACRRLGLTVQEATDLRHLPEDRLDELLSARERLSRTSGLDETTLWDMLVQEINEYELPADIPAGVLTGEAALDRAYALWGHPNARGEFLVGVATFSTDSDEDQWTYASMQFEGMINQAAEQLGYSRNRRRTIVDTGYDLDGAYTLSNGITIAGISTQHNGPGWSRRIEKPSFRLKARWAGLPDPGDPAPSWEDELADLVWRRISDAAGKVFRLKSGSPFSYVRMVVDGVVQHIEIPRTVKRSAVVTRRDLQRALDDWPVQSPDDLASPNASYLWALLADPRTSP